jgi:hypothetical protein
MARERIVGGIRVTSPASRDNSNFRVYVVWAPGRENFTYHYVSGPRAAARYLRLPGPTEGAMAAGLCELEDGEWVEWYHPEEGLEVEECVDEGIELPA